MYFKYIPQFTYQSFNISIINSRQRLFNIPTRRRQRGTQPLEVNGILGILKLTTKLFNFFIQLSLEVSMLFPSVRFRNNTF